MQSSTAALAGDPTDQEPGRSWFRVPLTTDLHGGQLNLTVHAVRGAEPGPTVAVVATVHGNEWFYIDVVRRLLDELQPETLRGTVLAVPVANPAAFGQLVRATPDASDTPDLNRTFPGRYNSITEQLAQALDTHVLAHSDYLIQYDCGPWGWAIAEVMYGSDFPDPAVSEKSRDLAVAYGHPVIRAAALMAEHPGPRSMAGFAASRYNIPSILPEIGGSGFGPDVEASWVTANVTGTKSVLQHLGMLPGATPRPERTYICRRRWRVNPSIAGMLEPNLTPEDLGKPVRANDLVGVVRDPYTLEVLEELRAPGDGLLFYVARHQPVRPGDFSIGIMDTENADVVTGE
ncbi:MAG: uncharacterized protein QOF33_2234 [Thermomicrobiales bacterium]|jgi:predicted deacylase|nr:uncharacterized protein [Thermomicrobiales bacterium]